jgi:hypothetical protein
MMIKVHGPKPEYDWYVFGDVDNVHYRRTKVTLKVQAKKAQGGEKVICFGEDADTKSLQVEHNFLTGYQKWTTEGLAEGMEEGEYLFTRIDFQDRKGESHSIATDEPSYLLNDDGKTIERLS